MPRSNAIDLFCSLIYTFSVTKMHCAKFSRLFCDNNFGKPLPIQCMEKIIGVNRAETTLHGCIFVMDKVKVKEQKVSIATGPL